MIRKESTNINPHFTSDDEEEHMSFIELKNEKTVLVDQKYKQILHKRISEKRNQRNFNLIAHTIFYLLFTVLLIHFYILNLDKESYAELKKWLNFERLRETKHQKIFQLNNVKISSNFDSGNLAFLEQATAFNFEMRVGSETYFLPVDEVTASKGSKDAGKGKEGYILRKKKKVLRSFDFKRSWFMFKLDQLDQPVTLEFKITNLSFGKEALKNGIVPVYKQEEDEDEAEEEDAWQEIDDPSYLEITDNGDLSLKFSYTYDPIVDKGIYFALTFPWTLDQNKKFYDEKLFMENFKENKNVKISKENLGLTKDSRSLDVYWIANTTMSTKSLTNKTVGGRKLVLLLSRSHGSEAIGSIGLRYFVEKLVTGLDLGGSNDWKLDDFIFLVIPMVNPDGVGRGYSTVDYNQKDPEMKLELDYDTEVKKISKFIKKTSKEIEIESVLFFNSKLGATKFKMSVLVDDHDFNFVSKKKREIVSQIFTNKLFNDNFEVSFNKKDCWFVDLFSQNLKSTRKLTLTYPTMIEKKGHKMKKSITLKKKTDPKYLLKLDSIEILSRKVLDLLSKSAFLNPS